MSGPRLCAGMPLLESQFEKLGQKVDDQIPTVAAAAVSHCLLDKLLLLLLEPSFP